MNRIFFEKKLESLREEKQKMIGYIKENSTLKNLAIFQMNYIEREISFLESLLKLGGK